MATHSCLENPKDGGAWRATAHGPQRVGRDWATRFSLSKLLPSFPGGSVIKKKKIRRPMQDTQVQPLEWEDPQEKEMATHSSIPAWEIPRTEEPGGLQSVGSQRVGQDLASRQQQQSCYHPLKKKRLTPPEPPPGTSPASCLRTAAASSRASLPPPSPREQSGGLSETQTVEAALRTLWRLPYALARPHLSSSALAIAPGAHRGAPSIHRTTHPHAGVSPLAASTSSLQILACLGSRHHSHGFCRVTPLEKGSAREVTVSPGLTTL